MDYIPERADSGELRVILYSHDSQGLGHTRRNLAIADALATRLPALLNRKVTGLLLSGVGTLGFPVSCNLGLGGVAGSGQT
ncbi:hypothetical protein [Arthrobacter roseus]|uniref:hypothetical protein n=1 Tax=Arthrobacter roseus TaxID=136274 RepID=UPI00196626D8|nr:hypothetical protein [Arthrobacter roseus]MBM7849252.1 putative glycosyltransferase [Arthrobacter roseus]